MASNVIVANYIPATTLNTFSIVWKLSRAMKAAGWKYMSSGNGSSKDTSGVAANDLWGTNSNPLADNYASIATTSTGSQSLPTATLNATNPQTAGFPTSGTLQVATSTNGWQTVTYTNTTASSFTGCSGGTGTVPSGSEIGDGYINIDAVAGWWNAQGPSTLKIPITTPQTAGTDGYFMRGEKVNQATTGAEGEIIGYLYDAVDGYGFLVVLPRIDGSGADPHGWDHTHVITGAFSGATVTPSSLVVEYVHELVFWKDTTQTKLSTYVQCVDGYGEDGYRYSVLATTAGCTATVAPGGGGTNNSFPSVGSYTAGGTGGSLSANGIGCNTGLAASATQSLTQAQIIAANCTYADGYSADGSFMYAIGANSTSNISPQTLYNYPVFVGFLRVDNQENGDVDPYVSWILSADTAYNPAFSAKLTDFSSITWSQTNTFTSSWNTVGGGGNNFFRMWRKRGFLTGDAFTNGQPATIMVGLAGGQATQMPSASTYWDRDHMLTATTRTYVGDDIWAVSSNTNNKIRKGVLRWVRMISGNPNDSYGFNNLRSWIALGGEVPQGSTTFSGLLIGPWDGYTIPSTQG